MDNYWIASGEDFRRGGLTVQQIGSTRISAGACVFMIAFQAQMERTQSKARC
jgi:hypothetical protein